MRRDELIDGKWYLVKSAYGYDWLLSEYKIDCFCSPHMLVNPEEADEWVEIDPEEIFKFIEKGCPGL